MDSEKLRERSRSVAIKVLAAVEAVERRVASGEIGAAISHAIQQLRGAIESLQEVNEPAIGVVKAIDNETNRLTAHLDARIRAMEERSPHP
jgi:hypothetical protein